MSRARTRRRKKAIERAQSTYSSFNASAQALIAQMKALQKSNSGVIYSPGLPLQPQPGVNPDGIPRQYSFPLAYNTSVVDRTHGRADIPPFEQLRYLAKMYSGITLPERVWLDMVPGLTLKIGLTPEMKAQGYDDKDFQDDIDTYRKFFEKPDKRLDYHSWLRKALRSQTQIDEVYVFKRRTRGGQLYALELVDGATMKPLLDDWGRIPEPPNFAYQQYLWGGLPGDWFTIDDMLHYQESPQDDSPFGFSRVERFIMEVNQALRKKQRDLAMFTEGNIPPGIMEVPEGSNWTPDDIAKFQKLWNSLKAGNPAEQVRMQFTQPGMKYIKLDNGEILTDFDYFLYKISCGCYGISLADIGFVEDIHKSSDKGQQNMMYRRTLQPVVMMYAKLFFTDVIHNDFNDQRFEASFQGYEEEEDRAQLATAYKEFAGFGAIAPSDVAHLMGFPDVPKTGPFIMGKDGPIFLADYEEGSPLRKVQQDAQMAGMQLAAQNPEGDTEQESANSTEKDSEDGTQPKEDANSRKQTGERARISELRRWRTCALHDVERGRRVRAFESAVIPVQDFNRIRAELERCTTGEEVKAVFRTVQEETVT